ncbi:hypothetical protein SAMN05216360_103113 [Methylobacterium phyllostachyos]|uniref:Uncharacterized protein n=1 Tax=Methylobacterium phyllostachyos TaxID=582672 RepID=A0A1G9VA81_9HYPH|nr:hypothetical protein [Methylobacterium phyllostachyos]SDM68765.1 hypothetical protein SAMN05216360_103113 [Methylobacterium phyllostachyos]
MLKSILAFAGLTPAPTPKRPPSARRTPASATRPTPAPVSDTVSDAARTADLKARAAALRTDPNVRFVEAVATVVRTYDRHSTQPSAEQLHIAINRLGEAAEYIRAVYAGGGRVAVLPLSQHAERRRTAAYREHIQHLVRTDLDRWEAGAQAVDKAAAAAKKFGDDAQPPIALPDDVREKLDQRALEKLRRINEAAARRSGGGQGGTDGSSGPQGGAAPATPPVPPVAPKGDDEPEGHEPPAGPKR